MIVFSGISEKNGLLWYNNPSFFAEPPSLWKSWKPFRTPSLQSGGSLGTHWGINRTMAQIHALLIISPKPLTTDQVMAKLLISRGNAHGNLRELASWTLVRKVIIKGERKEYFEAEKDPWRILCIVARERRRREIEPLHHVLRDYENQASSFESEEGQLFFTQLQAMAELAQTGSNLLEKLSRMERSSLAKWLAKGLG